MKDFENTLLAYYKGQLSREDAAAVEEWIAANPDNKQTADDVRSLFQLTDTLYAIRNTDENKALAAVNKRIRRAFWGKTLHWIERCAAVISIPLLIATAWLAYQQMRQSDDILTVKTNPGVITSVTLPDSTKVTLNSGSCLSYPSKFSGDERRVFLKGEAYFDVSKDKRHPFVVKTSGNTENVVLGTHFNVEAYDNDGYIRTTLEEGYVIFKVEDGAGRKREARLSPGQAAVFSHKSGELKVVKTEVDVDVSWKDNILLFRDTSAKDVMKALSKRYGVEFVVTNGKCYDNRFTGKIVNQRLDKVLEYLEMTSNMRFRYMKSGDINENDIRIEVY